MGGIVDSIFGGGNKAIERGMDQQSAMTAQATQVQKEMQEKSLAAQQEYWDKALAEAQQGRTEGLAALLAGSQTSLDLGRQQAGQQMSWMLPRQVAGMSALQALPQLQSALGLPSYAIPKTLDTSLPPQVDLMGAYEAALSRVNGLQNTSANAAADQQKRISDIANTVASQFGGQSTQTTQSAQPAQFPGNAPGMTFGTPFSARNTRYIPGETLTENPYSGGVSTYSQLLQDWGRLGGAGGPPAKFIGTPASTTTQNTATFDKDAFIKQLTDAMNAGQTQQQTPTPSIQDAITQSPQTQYELQPSGEQFNMQASPLYDWQKGQITENMNRALAARGIGGGAPAAAVLGNAYTQLAAEERQRQVADLQNLAAMGMGIQPGQPMGIGQTAAGVANFGANLGNTLNQSSAQRQGLYSDIGSGLGNAYAAMGASQGQGLLNLGQIQAAGANAMAQQPSFLSQVAQLGGLFGSGGMFGAGGMFGGNI